jgi:hypothetical protein
VWNAVVIAKLEKLSVHLPGGSGEFYEKSGWTPSGPLFEPEISRIRSRSTAHSTALLYILRNKTLAFVIPNAIFQHLSDKHIKH